MTFQLWTISQIVNPLSSIQAGPSCANEINSKSSHNIHTSLNTRLNLCSLNYRESGILLLIEVTLGQSMIICHNLKLFVLFKLYFKLAN